MLDLGWTELLVIGIVALIVVGPKDLPGMFQAVGRFVGKAKGMAREFSRAMNDAARESGVSDISETFRKASNPMSSAMDEVKKSAQSVTRAATDGADSTDASKPALSEERQAQTEKIRERAAEMASARQRAEAESKIETGAGDQADAGADTAADAGTPASDAKRPAEPAADQDKA
mgnify:CR=1 FL=1